MTQTPAYPRAEHPITVDPFARDTVECPFPMYKHLREHAPVAYLPEHDMYMVTTHALCMEVLRNPATFRQWDGDEMFAAGEGPPLGRPSNWSPQIREAMAGAHRPVSTLVNANPPRHTRYRKLANKLFSARRTADAMEGRMLEIVKDLIDDFPPGEVEFVSAFAVPFPIRVIADVLGFPEAEYPTFKRWTDSAMVGIAGGVPIERLVAAARDLVEFQNFLLDIVDQRRRAPSDDVVGFLANATVEEDGENRRLTNEETIGLGLHLLTGGGETTTNLLGSLALRIVTEPGLLARLGEDPDLAPSVIEETLRLDSPFQALFRRTRRETELGGVTIPAEAKVLVVFGAANRDEAQFADSESFCPERASRSHIAFGFGTHFCLGAPLTRREAVLATQALVTRLPGLRLREGSSPVQNEHAFLRGLSRLDLTYDDVLPG
jgi:cytochrome P450